jgi:peptidyl-prolyl cis-trans isomerase D
MMASIRAFAKSPAATVLLSLVLIAFLVLGVRTATTSIGARDEVVKVDGRPAITSQMFKDRFNFAKTQAEQQNGGQSISTQDAVKQGFDRQLADDLAASEAYAEMFVRLGLHPSDKLIVAWLRKNPRFFNQITGQFDKQAYAQLLAQNNMTPAQAEGELRDEISERQFVSGMAAGLRAPLSYAAMQAAYLREARTFQWFLVGPQILGAPAKPTDDQLNAFIKQNSAQFMLPERRQLSVVHVSASALAPGVAAPDADVQKRFNFEKDTLSSPEKRTFVQVPVKDAKSGPEIVAKLKAGVDPQALGKLYGVQAVSFRDQAKPGVPDKAIANAAFSLKAGETSGVIQGDLGPAVVRVFAITPAHDATLAEARPKIEAEVKQTAAQQKAYDLVQKYEDAHGGGADMAASAKAAGVEVATTPPIVARGIDLQGQPANLPPKVLQAAFSLSQGGDADPIDAGQGEYYIVHVAKVIPPSLPALDEIRGRLTQYFILRDAAAKLQTKAQALQAAVQKGQSMAEAAKSVGAALAEGKDVLRSDGGQTQPYSTDLVGRVFQAKPNDVIIGQSTKLGYVVAKLERITPADPKGLAPLALGQRPQVTKSLFDDIGQATRTAASAMVKPHVDYARARSALGVTDPSAPSP